MENLTIKMPKNILRTKKKFVKKLLLSLFCLTFAQANANPTGGSVIAGNASITHQDQSTTIQQTSDKAIIDWASFNIGANETTRFQQPGSSSLTLNRVLGNDPSQIFGNLIANGQIFLINAAGILFGSGAKVDVAGLVATTMDINNNDFLAGNYHFAQTSGNGYIINNGQIQTSDGGYVILAGNAVVNNGIIQANLGKIALASGTDYTLDLNGDGLINFAANSQILAQTYDSDGQPIKDSVANHGSIIANGGKVLLTANTAKAAIDNAINNDGLIEATSLANVNGEIVLSAATDGNVRVAGKLDVSGNHGGNIKIHGKDINLVSATLDANGVNGGGNIEIGSRITTNQTPQTETISIDKDSHLDASATTTGDAGNVLIWSKRYTNYQGNITATGGSQSGNGGFAEVSGEALLNFKGKVNLSAAHGAKGTLLLDPYDIVIQDTLPTTNGFDNNYTGTLDTSYISTTDIQNALENSDVVIQTGAGGSQAGNITLNSPLEWDNSTQLTLKAHNDININSSITNNAWGNNVVLDLRADSTGTGTGTINFGIGGVINIIAGTKVAFYYNPAGSAATKYVNPTGFSSYVNVTCTEGCGEASDIKSYMLVNNLTDLQNMSLNLSGDYALGRDIDASATSNWNSGLGFAPIGNNDTPFTGTFAGLGNTISNLTIHRPTTDDVGLFGFIYNSNIDSLALTNVNITGQNHVGAVAGDNYASDLSNILVNGGSITGNNYVGGILGHNFGGGYVQAALNTAAVTGNSFTAGIVGQNEFGFFSSVFADSQTTGQLSATDDDNANYALATTTANLKQQSTYSTFEENGFDFNKVWQIVEGVTYASLRSQNYSGGTYSNNNTTTTNASPTVNTALVTTNIINQLADGNSSTSTVTKSITPLFVDQGASTGVSEIIADATTDSTNEDNSKQKLSVCKA